MLHPGSHPAGAFGSNKTGISGKWRAGSIATLNPQQRAEIDALRNARAIEQERAYSAAADRAGKILRVARQDATAHPYCIRKSIRPFGIFQNTGGALVVPIFDARSKYLQSLQFIEASGEKRFLPGGRLSFGCCPLRHSLESFKRAAEMRIGIAEGFATGATLAHVLGDSVAMFAAFSAGNLQNVATALREHYPDAEITLYADNDANEVGQRYATKAATAVNGLIAIPPTPGADWNDFARAAA